MKNGLKDLNFKKFSHVLSWLWLAGLFFVFVLFVIKRSDFYIDSDMSSELILSKLLSEEHGILSKNWYYSTELRVINTQLVYSFLFLFTGSYKFVRIAGTVILAVLMLLSYYFFCSSADLKEYFPVTAAFLIVPFATEYRDFVLMGTYYVPHIALSFIILGLIIRAEKTDKKKTVLLILSGVVSFLAGLGGPRQVFVLFIPLSVCALWYLYKGIKRNGETACICEKMGLKGIFVSVAAGVFGYLANVIVLGKIYDFSTWGLMEYTPFSLERFTEVIQGYLTALGYRAGDLFTYLTVTNGIAACLAVFIILYFVWLFGKGEKDKTEMFTGIYFIAAFICFTLLYSLTDMHYGARYAYPFIMAGLLPAMAFTLKNHGFSERLSVAFGIVLLTMVTVSGGFIYGESANAADGNGAKKDVMNIMLSEGYNTGYATFWNANVITELSNGQIDMYSWSFDLPDVSKADDLYEWLQLKSHFTNTPDGKLFILLAHDEVHEISLWNFLEKLEPFYINSEYVVYTFDSYEDMIKSLSDYSYDLGNDVYLDGGYSEGDKWIIEADGAIRGPYTPIYNGRYILEIEGENVDGLFVEEAFDLNGESLNISETERTPSAVTYEINAAVSQAFVNIFIQNESNTEITVTDYSVIRQ